MIIAFAFFSVIALVVTALEISRTSGAGPDLLSLLLIFFGLQIILPGIVIPLVLALVPHPYVGLPFFDRIYSDLTANEVCVSAAFAALFIFGLYVSFLAVNGGWRAKGGPPSMRMSLSGGKIWSIAAIGVLSSFVLLRQLSSDGFLASYRQLILFRAQDPSVYSPSFLTSNLFTLTQAFSIFSILMVTIRSRRYRLAKFLLVSLLVLFLGVMTASRRGVALQIILVYFAYMLFRGRWYFIINMVIFLVMLPIVIWGKEFLALLANGKNLAAIADHLANADVSTSILSGMSYLGISLTSSWATLLYLDLPTRFGLDHLLSILRFLPLGFLGYDESMIFPERITRISTAAFVGEDQLDIPPGLIGAMWLDGWVLGPLAWGIAYGTVVGLVHRVYNRFEKSFESAGVFVIVLFVIALPLNTGSLDFNFSIDMLFLLIFTGFVVKVRAMPEKNGGASIVSKSRAASVSCDTSAD